MKNLIILILMSLVFTACQTEDNKEEAVSSNLETTFEFKELTNSAIGIEKDGKIELRVSNEKLMSTFTKFTKTHSPDLKPVSFEVLEIDNKSYLRYYSEDNMVSTIALIKGEDNQYRTEGTVCETRACASGGGCVPDGLYCTECTIGGGLPGDCKRITTGPSDPNGQE